MVWINLIIAAVASTTLISLAPNVLLFLFPHYGTGEGESSQFLTLGQALAAGGLLGDVFLHTIPHAGHQPDTGLWIMLGFTIFFVADLLLRSLGEGHHSHHQQQHHNSKGSSNKSEESNSNIDDEKTQQQHHHHHHTATISLNLAADALHNFTDGLAIGASFSSIGGSSGGKFDSSSSILSLMKSRGGLATLSILFHEIPHELGDFAVLVRNGFSKKRAIAAQFGTALAALAGTLVGLFLEGYTEGDSLMLITAGGFVYLAAVNLLPEILEEEESSTTKITIRYRLAQFVCFLLGIGFMYAVGLLEAMDDIGHHHHDHHHHAEAGGDHHAHAEEIHHTHHEHHDHHHSHEHSEL